MKLEKLRARKTPLLMTVAFVLGGITAHLWPLSQAAERRIIDDFHLLYHNTRWENVSENTRWLGVPAMKTPLDLWVFQEIIYETKPDVLVETGTNRGGSAYYYATVFDMLGRGRVYTMDVEDLPKPAHPRVNFRLDSSTSDATLAWIKTAIKPGERVMVTLDSLHTKEHVLAELDRYAPLVTQGNYLVVEDTHLNGHPVRVAFSPGPGKQGPWEALAEWLPKHPEFARDATREKFALTFNPGGWLKRVK